MKVQCLGYSDAVLSKCFILKLRQMNILIDCPLELLSMADSTTTSLTHTLRYENESDNHLSFNYKDILTNPAVDGKKEKSNTHEAEYIQLFRPPDFSSIDVSTIDFVLISNSKMMLGLPYLTEYLGFRGKIYATEPTIEFGRQLMEEYVHYFGESSSVLSGSYLETSRRFNLDGEGYRPIYTLRDVKKCVDKARPIRYHEQIDLYATLKLSAHSSGYSIGSANWLIRAGYENIVFLSTSSMLSQLHPSPVEVDLLKNASTVVVSDLRKEGDQDVSYDKAVGKISGTVARYIKQNNSLVFPIDTTGPLLFDLIPSINLHLTSMSLPEISYFVVSPIADKALLYSNICGEWLAPPNQSRIYLPESPLPHGPLMDNGRVKHHKNVGIELSKDMKGPCVIFTGHTNLRGGPVEWFMRTSVRGEGAVRALILTDPELDYDDVLTEAQHQLNLAMIHIPIDTRISFSDFEQILRMNSENAPRNILIPAHALYMDESAMDTAEQKKEWVDDKGTIWTPYTGRDLVVINAGRIWEKGFLSAKLASDIRKSKIDKNSFIAPVVGILSVHNNQYELRSHTSSDLAAIRMKRERGLWGNIKVDLVLMQLKEHGIESMEVVKDPNTQIITITLPSDMDTSIEFHADHRTLIKTSNDAVRDFLRKTILKYLIEI